MAEVLQVIDVVGAAVGTVDYVVSLFGWVGTANTVRHDLLATIAGDEMPLLLQHEPVVRQWNGGFISLIPCQNDSEIGCNPFGGQTVSKAVISE
jgi:hypothetical protein